MSQGPAIDGQKTIQVLDELVARAHLARASDIHITPRDARYEVRLRVDGVMVDRSPLPHALGAAICSRVKVLARMDISDKMIPQDGVFTHEPEDGPRIAVRCSTFPSLHGEKVVMRLLATRNALPLGKLGMNEEQTAVLRRLMGAQGGLVVVTGPTGAGKTSTLYAMLRELDTRRRNVVTLEDPVEVELRDVVQGQLNRKRGFDFANGLRAILRQDPDVIMVGEMRDPETASIAMRASLTGHLVVSSMHTNSIPDTITRLVDLGLEPYIVANALLGIVSQRLVRLTCPNCKVRETPARLLPMLSEIGFEPDPEIQYMSGIGCTECLETGYHGRTGIYEVAKLDDELRRLIKTSAGSRDIRMWLASQRIPTLRRQGMHRIASGETGLDEVLRQT